jgi:RNA polymerase sigma-70 factor (ECF subfamily)
MTNVGRKRRQEVATTENLEIDILSEVPSPEEETDSLARLEEDELRRRIGDAIGTLPENQRTAVTMFYVQEMTYEEIARVTGQPMGTVKTNLFRGREALRRSVLRSGKGGLPNER